MVFPFTKKKREVELKRIGVCGWHKKRERERDEKKVDERKRLRREKEPREV